MKWTPEQQDAIFKSGTNIIVSAGAGSGKTAVLSERVLEKIKSGIHINELLILTFTRAAADEMKYRIRKKLASDETYKEELDKIDSSYITTFDSFALSVLKKYHYMLNLPKNIKVSDESLVRLKKEEMFNEIFEELYKEKDIDFLNFIKRYSVKNDSNIRKTIISISNKTDGFIEKEEYFRYIKEVFYSEDNINSLVIKYENLVKEKQEELKDAIDNLNYYFDGDYVNKINDMLINFYTSEYNTLSKLSKVRLPNAPKGASEEEKNEKAKVKTALDDLLSYCSFESLDAIKKDILSTKEDAFVIIKILDIFYSRFKAYKLENKIFTFNDIAYYAIEILKSNESARLELKNSFKEIMIDEYQDTNDVQETFMSLISNDNIYMVGDIKQSIYRFRGSNPSIFKDKYENYSKLDGGIKIDLIKNFRSRSEVLDNINSVFKLIMDSKLGGADYQKNSLMVYGNKSYEEKMDDFNYNLRVLEYDKEDKTFENFEKEIFIIAKDIKDKVDNHIKVLDKETGNLRDINYGDFVIILDRSKYFDDYKKIFEYLKIPMTILKDGNIGKSDDIYLIKNMIDLILRINAEDFNEEFKHDILSIGRSYLYEYNDDILFDAIINKNYKELPLYKDFEEIKDINSKSPKDLFEEILDITNLYEKIYKTGDYSNVDIRLENIGNIASSLNDIGMGLEEFRDYLEEILSSDMEIKYTEFSEDVKSVKIMTIHKSKGLEFPICYFADLDHGFNKSDLNEKFIVTNEFGLVVPSENETSVLKTLYKESYLNDEISEKIRLFYVGLTRAKEQMIIVLPYKDTHKESKDKDGVIKLGVRKKYSKLSDFVYSIKDYLNKYFEKIDLERIPLTKNYLFIKKETTSVKNEITPLKVFDINIDNTEVEEGKFSKETTKLVDKKAKENMNFGTKVHEALELVDFKKRNTDIIEDKFIREKVENFLSNLKLDNIDNANIYHEFEFIYEDKTREMTGIIDLMIEYEDHIDIIDYKLKNVDDENYINQLNGYRDYIKTKKDKRVDIYLYSILNNEFKNL